MEEVDNMYLLWMYKFSYEGEEMMRRIKYPIRADIQTRELGYSYDEEGNVWAITIIDHTGYKITFGIKELQDILMRAKKEKISEQKDSREMEIE